MTAPIKGLLLSISNEKKKLKCNNLKKKKKQAKACEALEKKERKLQQDMDALKKTSYAKDVTSGGIDNGRIVAALLAIFASIVLLRATDRIDSDNGVEVSKEA